LASAFLTHPVLALPLIATRYTVSPLRTARMQRLRFLPVFRPVVVNTPYALGGRNRKNGSWVALRSWPPFAEEVKGFRVRPAEVMSSAAFYRFGREAALH
jgi:hypothetical protein